MKRITLSIIIILVLTAVYAQDQNPSTAPVAPSTETPAEIQSEPAADTNTAGVNETTPKAAPSRIATPAVTRETKPVNLEETKEAPGLLSLTEGDFKYERIPGITVKKTVPAADVLNIADSSAGKTGGLSALSSDLKNNLIRGGIVLLIFILFIFYRSRGGKRRRRY